MSSDPSHVWGEEMESADRVRAVAEMLTEPRSASWVAVQAQVNSKTARKYLDKLVADGRLRTTEPKQETRYYPNPRVQFFEELEGLIDEYTKDELTAELSAMSDRIETWQTEYGVASPDALRTTTDESLEVEERRERERVIDTWEYTLEMRTLVRHAIRLYDDLTQFTASHTPTADATSGE